MATLAVGVLLLASRGETATCEPFCSEPCSVLNGDVAYECGACEGARFLCQPGAIGFARWEERKAAVLKERATAAPPDPLDPAPHCQTNRCNRVQEKRARRQRAAREGAEEAPPLPPALPTAVPLPAGGEGGGEDAAFRWTERGVDSWRTVSPETYERFQSPKAGDKLTPRQQIFLESNAWTIEKLLQEEMLQQTPEAGHPARQPASTSAAIDDEEAIAHEQSLPRASVASAAVTPHAPTGKLPPVSMVAGEEVRCELPRISGSTLRAMTVAERKATLSKPHIVTDLTDDWPAHEEWSEAARFKSAYGHHNILAKRVRFGIEQMARVNGSIENASVTVSDLIDHADSEHIITIDEDHMSTGENAFMEALYSSYSVPDIFSSMSWCRVFSFGGGHRGVQMMQHGVAWLALVTGSKLWHVAPPNLPRPSDRTCDNGGKIDWRLARAEGVSHCVLRPKEVIFVPDNWWHATCNLDPWTIGVGGQLWVPHFDPFSLHPSARVKQLWEHRGDESIILKKNHVSPAVLPPSHKPPQSVPAPLDQPWLSKAPPPSARPPPRISARPLSGGEIGDAAAQRQGSSASDWIKAELSEMAASARGCEPHRKRLGNLLICPILNGIWTSFLDSSRWGDESALPRTEDRTRIAAEMRTYDALGLDMWVGEDFDARVLSALEEHRNLVKADGIQTGRAPMYTVIVENGTHVEDNLMMLRESLGNDALAWVQLGPPAMENLHIYRELKQRGIVSMYGVEDFSQSQVELAHDAIGVATVQQEINPIAHMSPSWVSLCDRLGCQFVSYGPLLGGLLSDRYLGEPRPSPDKDHRDYMYTVDAWGGWGPFQNLLQALRQVGDRHGGISVATVGLAYVLSLPRMLAVIVGVRLGVESDHRVDSLTALHIELTDLDFFMIDTAVFHSDPLCQAEHCAALRKHRMNDRVTSNRQ